MTLRPEQRAAVVLRYFEDLSEADTAEALGRPIGTVKSRVSRGMGRLREELGEDA
jgi:DNA-directed RNA polymerase specialized sigma24 family protein